MSLENDFPHKKLELMTFKLLNDKLLTFNHYNFHDTRIPVL